MLLSVSEFVPIPADPKTQKLRENGWWMGEGLSFLTGEKRATTISMVSSIDLKRQDVEDLAADNYFSSSRYQIMCSPPMITMQKSTRLPPNAWFEE